MFMLVYCSPFKCSDRVCTKDNPTCPHLLSSHSDHSKQFVLMLQPSIGLLPCFSFTLFIYPEVLVPLFRAKIANSMGVSDFILKIKCSREHNACIVCVYFSHGVLRVLFFTFTFTFFPSFTSVDMLNVF